MFKKMSAVFQTNTLNAVGEPEVDLIDPKESQWVPDPSAPEPELEMDLVSTEQLCITEPKVDLVDPEELCAHGPSVPEPEAEVTSEVSRLENCIPLNVFQLEDRLRECTQSKTPVTEVWPGNLKFLYYRGLHITYCGLPSSYRRCFDINKYFMPAAKFTDKALRNPMSKVLIHCTQGLSHSATLFLVYLMLCHDMMVEEAFDHVMKVRCIRPYFGHLRQLAFLNADLVQHTGKI
uniref:Tyrosine specific protein phosphatases domain-containing protein n=1 Tax=Sinocyclocheilus anshuiensis TaxID=1608454 RepID=A0A671SIT2_9TELE